MAEDRRLNIFALLFSFSIISTIAIGLSTVLFAIFHDAILGAADTTVTNMIASGVFPASWSGLIPGLSTVLRGVLQYIDYFWLLSFLGMVFFILKESYFSRREGYVTIFTFLSYGVIIFLFFSSIIERVASYFYTYFFEGILSALSGYFPYMTMYLENYSLVNLIIIVLSVILNFVDFDMIKFNARKEKEALNDEI